MAEFVKWSEETIKRVRESIYLPDLVDPEGQCRRTTNGIVIRCPFHDDKEPSMAVYDRHYICFSGSCGAKGDAIEWLKQHQALTFQEAVIFLAQQAGITVQSDDTSDNGEVKALHAAKALFLEGQYEAKKYLSERGINEGVIELYECGFAHAKGCNHLFKQFEKKTLHKAGLYIDIGQDRLANVFRNRCMFPVYDGSNLAGFSGRVIDNQKPKYKNSPESDFFQKGRIVYGLKQAFPAIQKSSTAIIVEGFIDVLSLATHGVMNSASTMGTALTRHHYGKIRKAVGNNGEIVFCFDGDAAGKIAAKKAAVKTLSWMIDGEKISILTLPEGMDPHDLLSSQGAYAWNFLFERRELLSSFLTRKIVNTETPENISASFVKAKETLNYIQHAPAYKNALKRMWEQCIGISLEGS